MASPSFSSTLYDCATECALRRQKKICKELWGGIACNNCRFNISNYIDDDPRRVNLFMLQAETRASSIKKTGQLHRIVCSILIIFCLHSAYRAYLGEQGRAARREFVQQQNATVPAPPLPVPQAAPVVQHPVLNATQRRNIEQTLQRVATAMRNNVDVNNDGKTDCIDAAVLFYQWYPNRNEVRIIVNRNRETNMHHLFNSVLIDGAWRTIEPQAAFSGRSSFLMEDIWHRDYNPHFDRNATSEYLKYVR